jgi:hypothetical protein
MQTEEIAPLKNKTRLYQKLIQQMSAGLFGARFLHNLLGLLLAASLII